MPSKNNLSMLKFQKTIDDLKEDISKLPHGDVYINKITKKLKSQTYGLIDLIDGKLPTFSGWTVDPTDAKNITDDNINTFCTTGSKNLGAGYQYAYIIWDLGQFYNCLVTGVGGLNATAGSSRIHFDFWDGSAWRRSAFTVGDSSSIRSLPVYAGVASKIRLDMTSTAVSTITPNIREFHVWRLK